MIMTLAKSLRQHKKGSILTICLTLITLLTMWLVMMLAGGTMGK